MELEFGQKITVTHWLKRSYGSHPERSKEFKRWKAHQIDPCEVIVIGKRTLSDGFTEWTGEATFYNPDRFFTAYLVVKNMRENPFYVLY